MTIFQLSKGFGQWLLRSEGLKKNLCSKTLTCADADADANFTVTTIAPCTFVQMS